MQKNKVNLKKETLKKSAQKSSRYPFIAEHRGGPLQEEQHRQLIHWAQKCIMRVLPLFGEKIDERLEYALKIARMWEEGKASVGDARKAAFRAIDTANELTDPVQIAVARSVGHTVATAHMPDHAPAAAEYALKALACKGESIDGERKWQNEQLPPEIKKLVLSSRNKKSKFWKQHIKKTSER
jgi:hypothetical protein